MRTFKYVRLYVDNGGIYIKTPDKEALDEILARVESRDRKARVEGGSGTYRVRVDALNEVYYEVLRELRLNGWEPFAVTRAVMRGDETSGDRWGSSEAVHLRLEGEG